MSFPENSIIFIDSAKQTGDFILDLSFNDGTHRLVDFGPFLRNSRNPSILTYCDPAKFSQFRIENGDLLWGDYDLCFPIADLYDGRL